MMLMRRFSTSKQVPCATPTPEPYVPQWAADLRETVGAKVGWIPAIAVLGGTVRPQTTESHLAVHDINIQQHY